MEWSQMLRSVKLLITGMDLFDEIGEFKKLPKLDISVLAYIWKTAKCQNLRLF